MRGWMRQIWIKRLVKKMTKRVRRIARNMAYDWRWMLDAVCRSLSLQNEKVCWVREKSDRMMFAEEMERQGRAVDGLLYEGWGSCFLGRSELFLNVDLPLDRNSTNCLSPCLWTRVPVRYSVRCFLMSGKLFNFTIANKDSTHFQPKPSWIFTWINIIST